MTPEEIEAQRLIDEAEAKRKLEEGNQPPTSDPIDPLTDPKVRGVFANYDNVLREQAAENNRIKQENEELRRRANTPVGEQPDPATELLSNPRKMIAEEVGKAVAPLMQFVNKMQQNTAYGDLKARYLAKFPNRRENFAKLESDIDGIMINGNAPVNEQALHFAYTAALGNAMDTGRFNSSSTPSNGNNDERIVPAQIPSRTPAPGPVNKPSKIIITEQERSLAKARGMSDEEWVKLRDADNTFVSDDAFKKGGK